VAAGALVAAPAKAVATVQVETHVVLPLRGVATQRAAEPRGELYGVGQHYVWQEDKVQRGRLDKASWIFILTTFYLLQPASLCRLRASWFRTLRPQARQ
jgi:hypothetical protein